MSLPRVAAEVRENFGKGYARRLRSAGKVPAVLYSAAGETAHLALPAHQMELLVRHPNVLLELAVAGQKKPQTALVKQVQKDPVRSTLEHIDLIRIVPGQRVQVAVPLHIVGQTFAGTTAAVDSRSVRVEVNADAVPTYIEVNIEGLTAGKRVFAGDLALPSGARLVSGPRSLVVKVNALRRAATSAAAAGEG